MTRFEKAGKAPFSFFLPFQISPPPLFPLLLPLVFSAKCLQRQLSCIWGLKSLFSPLNPQGQTSYTSCQESKLQLSISLIVIPLALHLFIFYSLTSYLSQFIFAVTMCKHYQIIFTYCILLLLLYILSTWEFYSIHFSYPLCHSKQSSPSFLLWLSGSLITVTSIWLFSYPNLTCIK